MNRFPLLTGIFTIWCNCFMCSVNRFGYPMTETLCNSPSFDAFLGEECARWRLP